MFSPLSRLRRQLSQRESQVPRVMHYTERSYRSAPLLSVRQTGILLCNYDFSFRIQKRCNTRPISRFPTKIMNSSLLIYKNLANSFIFRQPSLSKYNFKSFFFLCHVYSSSLSVKFRFAGLFGSILSYGRINYKNSHSSADCCGCSLPYEHRPSSGELLFPIIGG